jgi:membrane fusion protein (multidrug efflux system)
MKRNWLCGAICSAKKIFIGSLIAMVFFVSFSCSSGNSKDNKSAILTEIPVLELTSKNIEVPKSYVADIQAVQFVEVRSRLEGFVNRIMVDEGEFVKKGQVLFQLTSLELTEMVNSANARLMQSKAEEKAAQVEFDRLKVLVDKNIITESELELANSKKAVAASAIQEAESALNNARTGLSYTTIRAPFDGIVDRIPYKLGSLVTSGDLMTNITDISEVFAYYKVTENEYLQFMRDKEITESDSVNQEITLILSDGGIYPYKGKLETMEADFEKGTGSIAFRVRFPNPEQLIKHGASGKVLMTSRLDNVYLIPQKSTFDIQDFSYVYLLDENNVVKVRSFKPIQRFGVFYVTEGFEENDRIIFEGIQMVKDGQKILPLLVPDKEVYDTLSNSL